MIIKPYSVLRFTALSSYFCYTPLVFSLCFITSSLLTILLLSSTATASSSPKISYPDHCRSVVPQHLSTATFLSPSNFLKVYDGHFSGGGKFLAGDTVSSPDSTDNSDARHFHVHIDYIRKTESHEIFKLGGHLSFQGPSFRVKDSYFHPLQQSAFQSSFVWRSKYVNFDLSGFWSESTGMICMVGTGSSYDHEDSTFHLSAVFKLFYPNISNIFTSIVSGTVESLDPVDSSNYFEKISVSAYAQKDYSYMDFPPSIRDSCSNLKIPVESRSFEIDSVGSYVPKLVSFGLKLEHGSDCSGGNCNPFFLKKGSIPSFLSLRQIYFSKEGRFHTLIRFYNDTGKWFNNQLEPEDSLVGEGFWDHERNRMCIVDCKILANSSVGDCTFGLSLWFPLVFTIKSRSQVMGRLWSNHSKNDPGYFSTMSIRDFSGYGKWDSSMKYKYSVLNGASECDAIKINTDMGSKTYPDGSSRKDLSFSMISEKKGGNSTSGHAYPLSIGDSFYADSFAETPMKVVNGTLWNVAYDVAYEISYLLSPLGINSTQISAEGLYNSKNGHLCMVGCIHHGSSVLDKQAKSEDSMDCKILIKVQFPPMDPKEGEHLNGTIMSIRESSDPLYFKPILFSSFRMYGKQATKSIWRMDIEIILVFMSLTLSCILIKLQIVYAKKHRDVLPAISITMLFVMTLGYFIPLILNFQSLLNMIQNKQNSLLRSSEWMVVKEVIARVLTLVAFVIQLRMLQVAWSARCASEGKNDLLVAERKTMNLCFALYIVGAMITWFVQSKRSHWWRWEDLFSYSGFIHDGFLLPQIIFNLFRRSQDKALSLVFYVGMTLIRIFPHFYDLYRAHNTMPHFHSSYIYASPEVDFYSLSWNIIISLAGILFVTFIFMQQRFGGNYILPSRFRKHVGYVTIAELNL